MQTAPVPPDEEARLRAIRSKGLVYSPSEVRFDRVTRLAQRHFNVATVLFTVAFEDILWFKSVQGLNSCSTARDTSFCGHVVAHGEPMIIENALDDLRFSDNPLVTGFPKIRFYAGVPVRDEDGVLIGTLCLIDSSPRRFDATDLRDLQDFAFLLQAELQRGHTSPLVSAFIENHTERQRELLIDPISGTWNKTAMAELLTAHKANASNSAAGLPLIIARMSEYDHLSQRFGSERVLDFTKFVAGVLRDFSPAEAVIGMVAPDAFLLICPGLGPTDTVKLASALSEKFRNTLLETHGIQALIDVVLSQTTLQGKALRADSLNTIDHLIQGA